MLWRFYITSLFGEIRIQLIDSFIYLLNREALRQLKDKLSELFDVELTDKITMFAAQYKYTG